MRKSVCLTALVLLVIGLAIILPEVKADYDTISRPDSAPDCIDVLAMTPTATWKKYGNTDKTRICYNISEILKICRVYEIRIASLEKQVAELTKPAEGSVRWDFDNSEKLEMFNGKKWVFIDKKSAADPNKVN